MSDPLAPSNFGVTAPPPISHLVEYYASTDVRLIVTNRSGLSQLVETVTLQFQADVGTAPIYVETSCGVEIRPAKAEEIVVKVMPDSLYLAGTNQFSAMIRYKTVEVDKVSGQQTEIHSNLSYRLVRPCSLDLGQVFISFKQPEDLDMANLLARLSSKAGFKPYLALRDPKLGTNQWRRITRAIASSKSVMVVWTARTEWGGGVRREVRLARKKKLQEILLIQKGLQLPDIYQGTEIEYQPFDADIPAPAFGQAVSSFREQILSRPVRRTRRTKRSRR